MKIEEFLDCLEGVVPNGEKSWKARCPVHQDFKPSLAISIGNKENIIMRCHAGCRTEDVLNTLGLRFADLYEAGTSKPRSCAFSILSEQQANIRDVVYRKLLKCCELDSKDQDALVGRGLTPKTIAANQYGTLSIGGAVGAIRELRKDFTDDEIRAVPGFTQDILGFTRTVQDHGLMIPVRDGRGRVQAVQLRTEDQSGKYKWFSSRSAGTGTPTHIPLGVMATSLVRITEGPLKADIVYALEPMFGVVGIPGVNATRGLWEVMDSFKKQGSMVAVLSLDMDWQTKAPVRWALAKLRYELDEKGWDTEVEVWDRALGKGLDDCLLSGGGTHHYEGPI